MQTGILLLLKTCICHFLYNQYHVFIWFWLFCSAKITKLYLFHLPQYNVDIRCHKIIRRSYIVSMKSLKSRSKNDYLNFKTLFTKEVKTKFIQVHLIEEVMLSQLGHICLFNDYGTLIFLYSSTHFINT